MSSSINKSERIKQLKEVLKKKHELETELRLKTINNDSLPFNRFSKYRRSSGSDQASRCIRRAEAVIPRDQGNLDSGTSMYPHLYYFEGIKAGNVQDLTTSFNSGHADSTERASGCSIPLAHNADHKNSVTSSSFQLNDQLTEDHNTCPVGTQKHKPSILKRKDENHSSGGASVSFDLDTMGSEPITRTKSTDSNLSCDTETGYWSGGENLPTRILKTRLKDLQNDGEDLDHISPKAFLAQSVKKLKYHKSILKDRRSSLGSTSSSSPESSLHGILKRKLSYDSSTVLHGANSLSTNSLDCLSSDPKPILKKKSSSEDLDESEWISPKPILKKQSFHGDYSHSSSSDGLDDQNIRPILKKSVHLDDRALDCDSMYNGRGILKRMGSKGSPNYYSMEDSLHDASMDGLRKENSSYPGIRHGSLPNPGQRITIDLDTPSDSRVTKMKRTDSEEDIISTLTVAEKRSIFLQMERESGAAFNREQIQRRRATQPVTLSEIEKASQFMQQQISSISIDELKNSIMKEEPKQLVGTMLGELSNRNISETNVSNGSKLRSIPRSNSVDSSTTVPAEHEEQPLLNMTMTPAVTSSSSEADPSKLSLMERVQLFNNLATSSSNFVRQTKRNVTSKRFQTQPVTDFEHRCIQYCVGIGGSRETKGNLVDELQLPKGGVEEVDCGEVSLQDSPISENDNGMRERRNRSDSSNEYAPTIEDQSFLKKRAKKPTYEIDEMEVETGLCEKSGNIAAKIAALKTNGEMNWKKRICKPIINNVLVDEEDNHRNIEVSANNKDSPSVIANRLSLLTKSQTGWKQRVSENDATDLTVQSKLEKAGKLKETASPLDKKSKGVNVLTPTTFTSKSNKNSAITDELERRLNIKQLQLPPASPVSKSPPLEVHADRVVRNITSNDNEAFRRFFLSGTMINKSPSVVPEPTNNISLDEITVGERQFLGVRRNIKLNRTHAPARNPIKSLASRLQEQSYTELTPEVRQEELKKRIQIENLSKTSHLSVDALAGLVSKEDFTAVKLKRAESQRSQEILYPLLIRIKGKRFVQIRLVPPIVTSLSSGDCFILITKEKVYQFVGEFSNRMERSKLADTLTYLIQKRDFGIFVNSITEVVKIESPTAHESEDVKSFFKALGGDKMAEEDEKLGDTADEEYEAGVIRTNRVFEVDPVKEQLIPVLDSGGWGSQPKYSILKDDKVLVFDFGSEMYVWSGCRAEPHLKRTGALLGREMFDDSYNFSEVGDDYSPLGPQSSGDKRPNWCWFKRVTHHTEPILFIEKFYDWPDESEKVIRIKRISESTGKDGGFNFTPCDVHDMLNDVNDIEDPTLELEGFDVSRGYEVHDEKEHRHYIITTLEINSWKISEFSKTEIDPHLLGHFYSTETYVVRWQYSVMQIGRDLKGNQSKHDGVMGRPRTAYFFWHGKDSKSTEQGTSALMTVELDKEKGPQIRVVQGREPPAFLALFGGLMFVHLGSPEDCNNRSQRLYVTMGFLEKEGHFVEVSPEASSFRSRGSFLAVDKTNRNLCLWHGCHYSTVTEKIAQKGAKYMSSSLSEHGSLPTVYRLAEFREGEETKEFWGRMGVKTEMEWRESYTSLRSQISGSSQITVFNFKSITGTLEAKPILSPHRKKDTLQLFPLLQEDLYNVSQPGLFLLIHGPDVWLWHGWVPRGDEGNDNTSTGSGEYRWAAERKAVLQTGVKMVQRLNGRGLLVHAGLEPPLFRCLFPYWSINQEARECNIADGKLEDGAISFSSALEPFTKKTYSLEELQERPEGVDLLKLEDYLSDSDFSSLLKMSRMDFDKLQQWRKTEIKKQVGLF